jgi:thiol-disulfide isomerase/thioredoxin
MPGRQTATPDRRGSKQRIAAQKSVYAGQGYAGSSRSSKRHFHGGGSAVYGSCMVSRLRDVGRLRFALSVSPRILIGAVLTAAALFFAAGSASALEFRAYTPEGFAAAQAEGRPIIVDVHATWCPTCQAQRRVIEQLAEDPRFDNVVIFVIDYDTEKAYMRMQRVSERSTLIAFRGSEEHGRLYAVTSFEGIQALFLGIVE